MGRKTQTPQLNLGRFVTQGYANRNPQRTQREQIPNPWRGDTGRRKRK